MSGDSGIYGLHAVLSLLEAAPERVRQLWVQASRENESLGRILELAREAGIPVERVRRESLDRKAGGGRHQGVVASAAEPPALDEADLAGLLDALDRPPLLLVLDGVQDPRNLGACLRTADAAGVDAVIVPRDRASGLTGAARKAAAGAAETVPLVRVVNLARCLRALKERGIWVVGADAGSRDTIFGTDLAGPVAVVLGAEGSGLRRLTREHCDLLVALPMLGRVESLNVAVTAGIVLYHALSQRLPRAARPD
ncbi:MAG: 23S rRNA (guanosine(2251)-2'-O)-methyltransferase RlmB [Gammaproteobacteria bacterium]